MFGFFKSKSELDAVDRKLGRLVNVYQKLDLENDQRRSESRIRLALPCIIFLASELHAPKSYAVGVTSDVSLRGVGVITVDKLELGDFVLVFGPEELRVFLLVSCKSVTKDSFGSHAVAFSIQRVLDAKEQASISSAISALETAQS